MRHRFLRNLLSICCSLFLLASVGVASAQDRACVTQRDGSTVCPPPDSSCVTDRYGDVHCSSPGGGITFNRLGEPVCGPGYCTKDSHGEIFCSSAPRGAASNDRYGKATCAVACVAATRSCVKPVPAK